MLSGAHRDLRGLAHHRLGGRERRRRLALRAGFDVCGEVAARLVQQHKLTPHRDGRRLLFDRADLRAYVGASS
jgi:hypothetical protein